MHKVLVLSFSEICNDPRVMRQVHLLEKSYDLTVVGFGGPPSTLARYVRLGRARTSSRQKALWVLRLLSGAFEEYYWGLPHVKAAMDALNAEKYHLIIANDLSALPVCVRLAGGSPVLFDAHEYAPREYENEFIWRLLFRRYNRFMCGRYISNAASVTTVCQGIADAFMEEYGVRPTVIHNAPFDQHLPPSAVDEQQIRLVHHGVASRARRLELLIDMMSQLDDRFTLDFMLVDAEPQYLKSLVERASGSSRIRFRTPVSMPDICSTINAYDIGVYLLRPDNFNHRYALPNKFFEFIQARLAIAIGPSPEMKTLVEKYQCGVVADSFDPKALAKAINELTPEDIIRMKASANRAAIDLSYEQDGVRLAGIVERLISTS